MSSFVGGRGLARGWAVLLLGLWACADPGADVLVTLVDPAPSHIHAPGSTFRVQVTLSDPGIPGARTFAQWVDPSGSALTKEFELGPGTHTVESPNARVGYYGLVFTNENSGVAFPPQEPGFPSSEYGFAILPEPSSDREPNSNSLFGIVHGNWNDPYLAGGLKTLTWNTTGATWWAREIQQRQDAGLIELPIVCGAGWDSGDDVPITVAELDALEAKFRDYQAALPSVSAWELGIEENLGSTYKRPHYFRNLAAKTARVREVAVELGAQVDLVYQFEGFDTQELDQLLKSGAMGDFDVLSLHPYKWKTFPDPEHWFGEHVRRVRSVLAKHGAGDMRLWITEFGLPVRGTNNPKAFFGYPRSNKRVPGATREHQACYLVKAHLLAAEQRIDKLFTYNYQNRGNDVQTAEHHFGLRSYTGDKAVMGHPLPSYVAYAHMIMQLEGKTLVRSSKPRADVWVFEFSAGERGEDCIVAWVYPKSEYTLGLSDLRAGLTTADVLGVSDLYGTPLARVGSAVTLSGRPVFIAVAHAPVPRRRK